MEGCMNIEQTRALVVGRLWQGIARSGVDLSALPREQQEQLVQALSDEVLLTVNELLGEEAERQAASGGQAGTETVLWEGRPFLSLFDRYTLTTERVRISSGALGKDHEAVELVRMQDVDYSQSAGERLANIGDITIRSADASDPIVVLRNVHDPEQVAETIRRAWLDARKRYNIQFREEM
jgi:hypothetical protein